MIVAFGLPDGVTACLFDLDGVLTDTASVHMAAWKALFDGVLAARGMSPPFSERDYQDYVDGKPRNEGTKSFLDSRKIDASASEIEAMGKKKNALFLAKLHKDGVHVYPGSLRYLKTIYQTMRTAVVSSSTNCHEVVKAAGLQLYLEVRVDGVTAKRKHLAGKPAPDTFAAAAKELALPNAECAVFEDALAGVQAGHAGKFGVTIGVDRISKGRGAHAKGLKQHGADRVVTDLAQLLGGK